VGLATEYGKRKRKLELFPMYKNLAHIKKGAICLMVLPCKPILAGLPPFT
jgi:hypothetical protein